MLLADLATDPPPADDIDHPGGVPVVTQHPPEHPDDAWSRMAERLNRLIHRLPEPPGRTR